MLNSLFLGVLLTLASSPNPAVAHGGGFQAPGDSVPPGAGGGPSTTPPTGGSSGPTNGPTTGPTTGGPASPADPGPGCPPTTGGPSTPAGPGKPPAAPGPTTGGVLANDPASWAIWWEIHKDPYLQIKRAIHLSGAVETGDAGFFTGRGSGKLQLDTLRPSPEQIHGEALPALLALLESASDPNVITGCLIAIARIGVHCGEASDQAATIAGFLKSSSQEVRETAAIALGILGSKHSIPLLGALCADAPAGRAAVGSDRVDTRTRAFAAYGLGLLGAELDFVPLRRHVVRMLAEALPAGLEEAQADLPIALITALGLISLPPSSGAALEGDPADLPGWTSLEAQIELLLEVLENARGNWLVRAHAPLAAARLIESSALAGVDAALLATAKERLARRLLERLDPRASTDDVTELRQSAVQALGRLGDCDADPVDAAIRKRLLDIRDPDRLVERFALIAIARIGARDGAAGGHAAVRDQLVGHLIGSLERGRGGMERWSAIALGVLRRDLLERGGDSTALPRAAEALKAALSKARAVDDLGAFAVANGIFGNPESVGVLAELLRTTQEPAARGYIALGLGLLGAHGSKAELRAIVKNSSYRPDLLRQASAALGLLGDKNLAPLLAEQLGGSRSTAVQASAANALGLIGDRRTIQPLIEMLEDRELTDLGRAFAAAALGLVADRAALPWNTGLRIDVNYGAAVSTLNDPTGKGLLNLL